MYHRQKARTRPQASPQPTPRTRIDTLMDGSYRLVVDRVEHRPLSQFQFNQLAQQVLNVLQLHAATVRRTRARG